MEPDWSIRRTMQVGFARVIWAEYIAPILLLTSRNAPESYRMPALRTSLNLFSVRPLCPLCLCGECLPSIYLTTEAQRTLRLQREEIPCLDTPKAGLLKYAVFFCAEFETVYIQRSCFE
jgi:hypothetical protein